MEFPGLYSLATHVHAAGQLALSCSVAHSSACSRSTEIREYAKLLALRNPDPVLMTDNELRLLVLRLVAASGEEEKKPRELLARPATYMPN